MTPDETAEQRAEKGREQARRYYHANRERVKERMRRYRQEHAEAEKARAKRYYDKHKAVLVAKQRARRQAKRQQGAGPVE